VSEHSHAQDGEHPLREEAGDAHRLERAVQLPAVVRELPRNFTGALFGRQLRAEELVGHALVSFNLLRQRLAVRLQPLRHHIVVIRERGACSFRTASRRASGSSQALSLRRRGRP
jgi:hypothetical protein